MTKPFGPEELLARIRAALRRRSVPAAEEAGAFVVGEIAIDEGRRRVLRSGIELRLTPKEFELLVLLARNHDRVLTHKTILKAIWGPNRGRAARTSVDAGLPAAPQIEPDPARPTFFFRSEPGRLPVRRRPLLTPVLRNFSGPSQPPHRRCRLR